ncbi:MAG: RtcB family protein [Candidatus Anstonellales archaeon]
MREISEAVWEIEKEEGMNVPGWVFGSHVLVEKMKSGRTLSQLKNVARLPGILKASMVMPDGHEGYGFPIGGVAAFSVEEGIISPGGVGYDINCGVRLIATDLTEKDLEPKKRELVEKLFRNVPSGVGSKGRLKLSESELDEALVWGVEWAIEKGFGTKKDKERCEEFGRIGGADPSVVSKTAKKRGAPQFGTVGAGNHFVEIQKVQEVADERTSKIFGLEKGKIVVMLHCGSRGFGHQVCSDSLHEMIVASSKYGITLPDKELCCAPINSPEAEKYIKGMNCAINYAFNNRHVMMHWIRETFDEVFGKGTSENMPLIYDVCHNIAKFEKHVYNGKSITVCVHRKGATRAYGPDCNDVSPTYRSVGQPVLIPGSMGTASYVLIGTKKAMELTWGSTCHGSGRDMSRSQAIKEFRDKDIAKDLLEKKNILLKAGDRELVAEEAPLAYKNVDEVVLSVQKAGISRIVAKTVPVAVIKG